MYVAADELVEVRKRGVEGPNSSVVVGMTCDVGTGIGRRTLSQCGGGHVLCCSLVGCTSLHVPPVLRDSRLLR